MSASIVQQLVNKDLFLMRNVVLSWLAGGLAATVVTGILGQRFFIFGMILFVACMMAVGMHTAFKTVVEERRGQVLPFIMSLPITVRQYTTAKLIVNLAAFGVVWFLLYVAALLMFFRPGILAGGAIPFATIVSVGIFLCYIMVLATSLISESYGWAISSTVWANLGSQLYLWWVASLPGIRTWIGGPEAVWNGTVVIVLAGQIVAILGLVVLTYALQARKTDFV